MYFIKENLGYFANNNHVYSLCFNGLKKSYSREYSTRKEANEMMYKLIKKYNLKVERVYEDHHDLTYICKDGSKFFIDREY